MSPHQKQPRLIRNLHIWFQRFKRWIRRLDQDEFDAPTTTPQNLLLQVLGTTARYVRDIQWGYQKPGFEVIRAIWSLGWPSRLGLAALAVGTLGSAAGMGLAASHNQQTHVPGMLLSLVMFAIGWALALTATVEHSLWAYGLTSAYLIWYGALIGGSLSGTIFFAIPALWTLFVSAQAPRRMGPWAWVWQLLLCLAMGYLTFNTLGLGDLIPPGWHPLGRLMLGGIYFGLLELQKRLIRPWPSTDWVFWGTLLVIGGFLLLAAWNNPAATFENAALSFNGLLGLVSFFWFWLGGSFFQDLLGIGEWSAGETMRWLKGWASWLLPAVWAGVALLGWLGTYSVPPWLANLIFSSGFYAWIDSLSIAHYFTVRFLPVISLMILVAWIIYMRATRSQTPLITLRRLNGFWIAAIFILLGFFESLEAFSTLETEAFPELSFWPILVLLGGLWWDIAASGAEWAGASSQRLKAMLAFSGLMLSISIGLVFAGSTELILEYTLYSFLGLIYLGLPLSFYTVLQAQESYQPVPGRNFAALFGLGCLSAIIALKIHPEAGVHLGIVPLVWCLSLLAWGKPLARLNCVQDGIVAGVFLASGFVAFWMSPEVVPIPFLQFIQDWQISYLQPPPYRPLLQAGHFWLTLIALGAGLAAGWAFVTHRPVVRLVTMVLCALAFAWLIPHLPGMLTP